MNILVTAGPTREPIDPIRFISNRSTGKMGYAIAEAGVAHGHDVVLVSGPAHIHAPTGARLIKVVTCEEMLGAVRGNIDWCEAFIMTAAVADWRPREVGLRKLKKAEMPANLALERTPDIITAVGGRKGNRIYVGFAAETQNIISEARRKISEKGLDLIVANDVTRADSGFESDTNKVALVTAGGGVEELPLMSKHMVAEKILEWIESRKRRLDSRATDR